jgi:hypothetical protein
MRFTWWIASLWPGCWHAWQLGQWRGLALAVAFAAMVNGALITTFIWTEWFGTGFPPLVSASIGWLLVLGLWSAGLVWLRRDYPRVTRTTNAGKRTARRKPARRRSAVAIGVDPATNRAAQRGPPDVA